MFSPKESYFALHQILFSCLENSTCRKHTKKIKTKTMRRRNNSEHLKCSWETLRINSDHKVSRILQNPQTARSNPIKRKLQIFAICNIQYNVILLLNEKFGPCPPQAANLRKLSNMQCRIYDCIY